MVWKLILLWIIGISSGLMVSAGVFTVLFVVGLVPRFAGRTDTAWCEIFYEECLIFGAVLADVISVFPIKGSLGGCPDILLTVLLIFIGMFAGIFFGCLSIALAEVLDGIPIFGAVLADVLSVFPIKGSLGSSPNLLLTGLLVVIGVFAGIFVGCLSIALSEVLDGIPIFARRIRLKMGVSIAVLMVAVGKIAGSIVYFINGFFEGI